MKRGDGEASQRTPRPPDGQLTAADLRKPVPAEGLGVHRSHYSGVNSSEQLTLSGVAPSL